MFLCDKVFRVKSQQLSYLRNHGIDYEKNIKGQKLITKIACLAKSSIENMSSHEISTNYSRSIT